MTTPEHFRPAFLDAIADHEGSYVAAAQREADISDAFAGLGDPETDQLAEYHRAVSLALLARCCARLTPHIARISQ